MSLLILGVLVIVASLLLSRTPMYKRFAPAARLAGIGLVLLGVVMSSVVQIEPGQVGVKKLFGKVQNDVIGSGLHFINPLMEVDRMDVKTQNYTMSGIQDEGMKTGDDAIRVLTADGLQVVIDLTVLYRVTDDQAPNIVRNIGLDYTDKIVRPVTRTKIRDNAVYYDAVALYSTKRDEFQQRIFATISKDFTNRGLVLEQLLVRNITLPESVRNAIELKINAEQEAQKMQFVLQKETQEAERKRVEAQGIADYQRIINQGPDLYF